MARCQISLILPTYRRPALLDAALKSVAASQGCDAAEIEIVVVDNDPAASARPAVLKHHDFPFALRYAIERSPGASAARNAGARVARGATFVFMDDDQQIAPDYFGRLPQSFRDTGADCVGGWVGYVDAGRLPPWLQRLILHMGQRDLGGALRPITAGDPKLGGGNMAISREAFSRIGGFRTDLRYSEDIELQDRLLAGGGRIAYDPALRQYHYLEPERQRRSYYILRSFNSGRAEFRIRRGGLARVPWFLGAPRFLWRQVGESFGKVATSAFVPQADRFDRVCELAGLLGQLRQALGEPRTALA